MKTIFVDKKVTIWEREKYEFPDQMTEQEILEKICRSDENDYFIESNTLFETMEEITPEENNNFSTIEILDENLNILLENGSTPLINLLRKNNILKK
jgi:hypothetical protein